MTLEEFNMLQFRTVTTRGQKMQENTMLKNDTNAKISYYIQQANTQQNHLRAQCKNWFVKH